MTEPQHPRTHRVIYLLFFLSGISALLYQIIWTKRLALVFGVTTYAVSTTLSVFMLGLALGSWLIGLLADRAPRPLRLYVYLEAGIALSAAGSLALLEGMNVWIARIGFASSSSASFSLCRVLGSGLVLIIPTFLMGGTFPVLAKTLIPSATAAGRRLGVLYAANTLGAVIGCVLAGFVLIPAVGLRGTLLIGVGINLIVAGIGYALWKTQPAAGGLVSVEPAPASTGTETSPEPPCPDPRILRSMRVGFFLAGFIGLAAEVVWTRMLLLTVDATAQSFAAMLGVYLLGLSLGGAVSGGLSGRFHAARSYATLQVLVGLSMVACALAWSWLDIRAISESVVYRLPEFLPRYASFRVLLCLNQALVLVFLPTFLMGIAFPFAGRFFASDVPTLGRRLGGACMVNTLGSMSGPLVAGFLCLPWMGVQRTIFLCALGSVAAGTYILFSVGHVRPLARCCTAAAIVVAACALSLPDVLLARAQRDFGGEMLFYQEEANGSVMVLEWRTGRESPRQLIFGSASMISDTFHCRRYTRLIGHLPMLMHPRPREALVICLGAGMTLSGTLSHPSLRSVDCVDLSEAVIHAARTYFRAANGGALEDPRTHLIVNDGRTHLLATRKKYDVIALEPPPPDLAGVANLYSQEFYELCRERLNPDGMIAQWLPNHQVTPEQGRSMIATMQRVFPATTVWNLMDGEEYCFIGHMSDQPVPFERIAERLALPSVQASLAPVGIRTAEDLLCCFVLGARAAREFSGRARLITDDHPGLGYDFDALETVNPGGRSSKLDMQRASEAIYRFAEDPVTWLAFANESARSEFVERFTPVEEVWRMHCWALRASTIGIEDTTESLDIVAKFDPPHRLDPANPYYQQSNRKGVYVAALERLSMFHDERGDAVMAAEVGARARALESEIRAALSPEK